MRPPHGGAPVSSEPREIVELRRLKEAQPDLAAAVDLQIELAQLQRRVMPRIGLPSIKLDSDYLNTLLANPPVLQFEHLSIDWTEFRTVLRSTASSMRTHDAIEPADFRRAEVLSRDTQGIAAVARVWYESVRPGAPQLPDDLAGLSLLLQLSMRPFLSRAADAIMARTDFAAWQVGRCPLCYGEPDFAVITPSADRLLVCGRCQGRWHFDQIACPFCLNGDRRRITSFASRDGLYRLYGCDVCQRYIKAFDARSGSRPLLPWVDPVATLPLDAAAMQRGYR
jgi:formate dehydrogenase maturation protein FdhE